MRERASTLCAYERVAHRVLAGHRERALYARMRVSQTRSQSARALCAYVSVYVSVSSLLALVA
jgi:hypothetical protein